MKTTKRTVKCSNCGSHYFIKCFDENDQPIWECNNCHTETKRQVRVPNNIKKLLAMLEEGRC